MTERLIAKDWDVRPVDLNTVKTLVEAWHYARGCSKTCVHAFGLFHREAGQIVFGVSQWLPPTKPAAISVGGQDWRRVLCLSLASNVAGAAVDSIVFPLLAFGGLRPEIVATMFAAKVAGGTAWAWMLSRRLQA